MYGLSPHKENGNKSALFGLDHRYTLGPGSYNVPDSLMKKSFNVRASTSRKSNMRASPQKLSPPFTQSVCSSPTGTYVSIFPLSQNRREVKKPDSSGGKAGYWSGPSSPGLRPSPPVLSQPNLKKYLAVKSTATSSQSATTSQLTSPSHPIRNTACVIATCTADSPSQSASYKICVVATTPTTASVDDTDLHHDKYSTDQNQVDEDKFYHSSLTPAAIDDDMNCEVPK